MKRAGDVLEGERTGHESEADRILEAEAERGAGSGDEDLEELVMRAHREQLRRVEAVETRLAALDRKLDAIGVALQELEK